MIHYFVFDQFNPSNSSDYWKTEPGVELPDWLRHIAEEELVSVFPQIKSSDWGTGDFIAVMKKDRSGRACLFRVYSGGRDIFGRANRWVMLLAEGSHEDFAGTDVLSAAEWGVFEEFKALSREKKLEVPINITQRDWPKVSDSSWNLCSEVLQISDADMLRKVSLSLTSNSGITGTIWMQKIGENLEAKSLVNRAVPLNHNGENLVETGCPQSTSEDDRSALQNKSKDRRRISALILSLVFVLGAVVPTWLWSETEKKNELLREKNNDLSRQISKTQGSSDRRIKELEGELKGLKKRNSDLKNENELLREKLQRHEFFITNAEKLERCATEFRKKIDECMQGVSEVLNEIREESD